MAIHKENLPPIVKASTTSITLATTYNGATSVALIGGRFYRITSALTLNTGTIGALNGLDTGSLAANTLYYVYLCVNSSGVVGLVISTSSSAPSGSFFSAYKYIGKAKTFSGSATIADVNPLFVGDSFDPNGIEDTAWQSCSPVAALTTNASTNGKWRRVKGNIEIMTVTNFTGANTQGAYYFSLANLLSGLGFSLDTGSIPTMTAQYHSVGTWSGAKSGSNGNFGGHITLTGLANCEFFYPSGVTSASNLNSSLNQPWLFAINDGISGKISLPIIEFSGLFT